MLKKSFAFPIALVFFLSSCASYNSELLSPNALSIRSPSSSETEENLEVSFQSMMNSTDPEKVFLDNFDRLKSLFTRAESNLGEFDKELDESVITHNALSFEYSKSYRKLIVMWGLSHRLKDKMIFNYLKLTDIAYDNSVSADKRKLANSLLRKFKAKLDSNNPLEKISFEELKIEIENAVKARNGLLLKPMSPVEMPATSIIDDQEKVSILRKYRETFRKMGRIAQDSDDELNRIIEDKAEKLQIVDQEGREPQSELKFYPSTGPNGNVMGLIFPKNVWALTYDDGPNPVHTPVILKNLEELGIKATFFWLAENVIRYQSIVDMVGEKTMVRANHSWSHPQLPKLSDEGLQKEIVQSTAVESKSYGEKLRFFRCPYGSGNSVPRVRKMIADLGMIHVFWNVDTLDWQDKDPDSIVERAKKQMQASGHGVILFHDIHPQSVIASRKLIEWSKTLKGSENAIRWVTLPEIVDEMNGAGATK